MPHDTEPCESEPILSSQPEHGHRSTDRRPADTTSSPRRSSHGATRSNKTNSRRHDTSLRHAKKRAKPKRDKHGGSRSSNSDKHMHDSGEERREQKSDERRGSPPESGEQRTRRHANRPVPHSSPGPVVREQAPAANQMIDVADSVILKWAGEKVRDKPAFIARHYIILGDALEGRLPMSVGLASWTALIMALGITRDVALRLQEMGVLDERDTPVHIASGSSGARSSGRKRRRVVAEDESEAENRTRSS